jgi:hypothetical protein
MAIIEPATGFIALPFHLPLPLLLLLFFIVAMKATYDCFDPLPSTQFQQTSVSRSSPDVSQSIVLGK